MAKPTADRIKFNVGGKIFETTSTTIAKAGKGTLLGALLDDRGNLKKSHKNSEYFIDRNPKYFSVLLDLLRTGELDIPSNMNERLLYREALYYGLENHVREARWDPFAYNYRREPIVQAKPINFQRESKKIPNHKKKLGKNLVGSRIKVWWPDDRIFYEAVVASYDHATKKYKIIYDDGDIEKLVLENERWEYAESPYTSDSESISNDGFEVQARPDGKCCAVDGSIVKVNGMMDERSLINVDCQQKPASMPGHKKSGEHLVGCKIKVWWPQEKRYYDAVVESYYRGTKQHKIVYSDGDVELLVLKNERWKLVESSDVILEPESSKHRPVVKGGSKNNLKVKRQEATGLTTPKKSRKRKIR